MKRFHGMPTTLKEAILWQGCGRCIWDRKKDALAPCTDHREEYKEALKMITEAITESTSPEFRNLR